MEELLPCLPAHKLGTSLKLDPSHVYALLRSGVPATEDAIKTVAPAESRGCD